MPTITPRMNQILNEIEDAWKALSVLTVDEKDREWLARNDPMAYVQARDARIKLARRLRNENRMTEHMKNLADRHVEIDGTVAPNFAPEEV